MGNDIAGDVHCEITMGNDIARDIHCDIIMSNDVAMCTYHGITMHNEPFLLFIFCSTSNYNFIMGGKNKNKFMFDLSGLENTFVVFV